MSPVTEPSLRMSTRSPTIRSPSILPMTTTSRAETAAIMTPFRPTVTRLSGMLMVPSMRPSTYSVSAPETSPLMTMERPMVACSGEVVKDLVALVGPNAGVGAEPAGVANLSLGCSMMVALLTEFGIGRCARREPRETIDLNIPENLRGGQITEDGVRRKTRFGQIFLTPNPQPFASGDNLLRRTVATVMRVNGNHIDLQLLPTPSTRRSPDALERPLLRESGGKGLQRRPIPIGTEANKISSAASRALHAMSNTGRHGAGKRAGFAIS